MADTTLIDTLQFGPDDAPTHKYEVYGDDEKTPTYALIYQHSGGDWEKIDETLTFAAKDEQDEASSTMDYGSSDGLPELRNLPAEARERSEKHWRDNFAD